MLNYSSECFVYYFPYQWANEETLTIDHELMQTNLFPAFEGPDHKNLHTKGTMCVCNPFYQSTESNGQTLTNIKHRPLSAENQAAPPSWLATDDVKGWQTATA